MSEVKEYKSDPLWAQKTNYAIVFSIILIGLKYFGVIDVIPVEYVVNAGITTIVLVALKAIKWAVYLVIKIVKKVKAKKDED